jgi:putative membrane protein
MSVQLLLRAFHIFGAILWVGGVAAVSAVAATLPAEAKKGAAGALRGGVLHVVTPGMALAWIGGLGMLLPSFTTVYAHAGWMHAKLALVLLASALTGVITGAIRRSAAGEAELAVGKVRALGFSVMAIGLLVVLLVILRPF